jgi:hypothetical protein
VFEERTRIKPCKNMKACKRPTLGLTPAGKLCDKHNKEKDADKAKKATKKAEGDLCWVKKGG